MTEPQPHDILVTGVGVVSPIGIGRANFWKALRQGRSGVDLLSYDVGADPVRIGGELRDFDGKQYVVPKKTIKLMCREVQTAFAAATLAVADAELNVEQVDADRFGVVFGSEMLYGEPGELAAVFRNSSREQTCDLRLFGQRFGHDMFPLWMLSYLPNMAACHVAIYLQACGANNTIVQGDASSLLSIAEAVSVMRRGWCDMMLCGGTGTRINITQRSHVTVNCLATRDDAPHTVPRPFAADSEGEVLGEGAGAILLETREHAQRRNATPLAQVFGYGTTFGAAEPEYEGATSQAVEYAMQLAIQRTGRRTSEYDHVNAHGVARPAWDAREATAIHHALPGVPVMAPKSYFGNLGAGSGAIEAIASILALHEGHVPGILNHQRTAPLCPISIISAAGKPCERPLAMLLNQSTTGQAVAVVIGRVA